MMQTITGLYILYQTWNGTAWVDSCKNTLFYDANNNLIEQIRQTWSGTAWVNNSKYTSTYDANNNAASTNISNLGWFSLGKL